MKKTSLSLLSILIFAFTSCKKDTPQPTPNPNPKSDTIAVSENITQSTVWYKDSTYMIKGFVFVKNGATLIIQPGTKILGDRASKGTLIITRGSRIIADGTPNEPIVFTSAQPDSMKTYGDWGGLVILGNATINVPGGTALIEGGLLGQDATYGGTNDNDNSGTLRYVRIEYGGIAYQPNNEINGLTFGGVGRGTIVENVQVSYAGDDAFEWFGGTVNCKNLIAYKCWDDDFDTDFGFRGMIQFGLIIRDHNIADQSQSNGFESEGLHIDGVSAQSNATNDLLQLERITLVNMTNDFEQTNGANSWAGMNDYFNSPNRENATTNILELNSNYLPLPTSNLLNKASFTNPKLNNPFFTPVPYVGAFGTTNWTLGWARF